jgi:hypothetical protein
MVCGPKAKAYGSRDSAFALVTSSIGPRRWPFEAACVANVSRDEPFRSGEVSYASAQDSYESGQASYGFGSIFIAR